MAKATGITGGLDTADFRQALGELAEQARTAGNSAAEVRAAVAETTQNLAAASENGINLTPTRVRNTFSRNLPTELGNEATAPAAPRRTIRRRRQGR